MEKLVSICRVCLNEDAQQIKNIQLQEMYDKLTTTLFQSDMTPLSLCYICLAQLKASQRFMLKCLKAEEHFSQMMDQLLTDGDKMQYPIQINQSPINKLSISPVERTIIDSDGLNVDINVQKKIKMLYEDDVKLEKCEEECMEEHTIGNGWEDTAAQSRKQSYFEGSSTGAKNPNSEANQLFVIHIGSEKGFVPGSELVFECKGTTDQKFMNATTFENWFQGMLPRLEPNAVVVMDDASYHSRRKEKIPESNWRKHDIQQWLSSKDISFGDHEINAQLLERVKCVKSQYHVYVIDEMAKAVGVEVLRLPRDHCELNPFELVWADVKEYVARRNTTFMMADVKKLLLEGLNSITADKWQNFINHVQKEESKLEILDNQIDKTVDSFIINVTCDISDSASDTEAESDSN